MAIKFREPKKDKSIDGRAIIRSDSRPKDHITSFASRGDSLTNIGDGKQFAWDFNNSDDLVTDSISTAIPIGYKRKRIEVGFSEKIYIKEGTLYFHSAPKGCYVDFYVICKAGAYYKDPNGVIPASALGISNSLDKFTQATSDTIITHYVNNHYLQGDAPMGDELNTEGATESSLPTQQVGYKLWIEVTTPNTDLTSNGCLEVELYRPRTILLPGEAL